jgi:hypothetical protein
MHVSNKKNNIDSKTANGLFELTRRTCIYPAVDGTVLATGNEVFYVGPPDGRASVSAAVVEHTVNGDVLARLRNHLLWDVADRYNNNNNNNNNSMTLVGHFCLRLM